MERMTFDKKWLIDRLKSNREKHNGIFREAVEGYRNQALAMLNTFADRLKEGDFIVQRDFNLVIPQDHTEDYDTVIEMLENSRASEVELEQHEFQSYVRDRWEWRKQFLSANARFSSTAATMDYMERTRT